MIKSLSLDMMTMLPLIEEAIRRGSTFEFVPNGDSMLPLIRGGTDYVTLAALPDKLSVGDIILYRRKNGQAVLHRLIKKRGDRFYFCGDHQRVAESGITRDMMTARVVKIRRGDVIINSDDEKYKKYVKKTVGKKRVLCFFSAAKKLIKRCIGYEKGNDVAC